MDAIRQYLITLTAAAILCGVVKTLFGEKGTAGAVVRLLCGVFLTLSVISPLAKISLEGWNANLEQWEQGAQDAVSAGKEAASKSLAGGIKAQVEAYILDKAASLGADLTVEVTLNGDALPLPEQVVLQGSVSPYARSRLEQLITEDLGIAKENLIWMP